MSQRPTGFVSGSRGGVFGSESEFIAMLSAEWTPFQLIGVFRDVSQKIPRASALLLETFAEKSPSAAHRT